MKSWEKLKIEKYRIGTRNKEDIPKYLSHIKDYQIMHGSWTNEALDKPEHFYKLSEAYIDTSIEVTNSMISGNFEINYDRGRVVMFLAHHACKLFLKAAILHKTEEKPKNSHNLVNLYCDYAKHYPEEEFQFEVPFKHTYIGSWDEDTLRQLKTKQSKLDQKYRYPSNNQGKDWPGTEAFDGESFLETLISLNKTFTRLKKSILGIQ